MIPIFENFNLIEFLLQILALTISFTVHEFSHGLAAYCLGDTSVKDDGRLSLNPIRHIDPVGFICLLVFQFGWAKPVQTDVYKFKQPKQDLAITAFAGPLSNLLLAFLSRIIMLILLRFYGGNSMAIGYAAALLSYLAYINIVLAVFNMLPLPPLDGSKVIGVVLPDNVYFAMIQADRVGMVILLVLIFTNAVNLILSPAISAVYRAMVMLADKIMFFL